MRKVIVLEILQILRENKGRSWTSLWPKFVRLSKMDANIKAHHCFTYLSIVSVAIAVSLFAVM